MKRKKKPSGGGANWMDTYGDMVTLLLCFFVLLYSMSTISEEKWAALVMSFNPDAAKIETETPGGDGPNADESNGEGYPVMPPSQEVVNEQMEELFLSLQEMVDQQSAENSISVTQGDGKIFISFNQNVFFDGESPVLRKEAYPILNQICEMFDKAAGAIDEVRVLGHTAQGSPTKPNNVTVDRTLSSNRATNVVIYVQQHSLLDPTRLISEGWGQWHPVASNDTAEGRAKNRRVEMIISGRNLEDEIQENMTLYEVDLDET